jgi:hypothetical protein
MCPVCAFWSGWGSLLCCRHIEMSSPESARCIKHLRRSFVYDARVKVTQWPNEYEMISDRARDKQAEIILAGTHGRGR